MRRARHRVYGLEIETDFRFSAVLEGGCGTPELCFLSGLEAGGEREPDGPPAYASQVKNPDGQPLVELWRQGDRELLSFTGRTAFLVGRDCVRYSTADDPDIVELLFLSSVLAYVLERRGVLALHGSAIDVRGAGVCFLAAAGTGKSSLAAAFASAGYSLLTDDVVALEAVGDGFVIRPAFPEIKVNRDVGLFLWGSDFEALRRVHPLEDKRRWPVERAALEPMSSTPLRRVFVLCRSQNPQRFERRSSLSRLDASIEILRAGFTPNLVEAAGLAPDRLARISRLVARVPVTKLDYRSDIGGLPQLVDAVLSELAESPPPDESINADVSATQ